MVAWEVEWGTEPGERVRDQTETSRSWFHDLPHQAYSEVCFTDCCMDPKANQFDIPSIIFPSCYSAPHTAMLPPPPHSGLLLWLTNTLRENPVQHWRGSKSNQIKSALGMAAPKEALDKSHIDSYLEIRIWNHSSSSVHCRDPAFRYGFGLLVFKPSAELSGGRV